MITYVWIFLKCPFGIVKGLKYLAARGLSARSPCCCRRESINDCLMQSAQLLHVLAADYSSYTILWYEVIPGLLTLVNLFENPRRTNVPTTPFKMFLIIQREENYTSAGSILMNVLFCSWKSCFTTNKQKLTSI